MTGNLGNRARLEGLARLEGFTQAMRDFTDFWVWKMTFGAAVGWFLTIHLAYQTLFCMMALDTFSGVSAAIVLHCFSSDRFFTGCWKKSLVIMLVMICALMSIALKSSYTEIPSVLRDIPAAPAVAFLFCGHYFFSVISNAQRAKCWLPLPFRILAKAIAPQFSDPEDPPPPGVRGV